MKANFKENKTIKNSEGKPLLSIGMIVKNEEKYLKQCLEALNPIMGTGKVDLVIVDTGSTDTTVEIAKEFTDKVYYFEWIDDFAAARNYGLERCSGQWFMFIDADEIFDESVTNILKFLESKEADEYNSAVIHIRSYADSSYINYSEFFPIRIVRLSKGVNFCGKIHESLPVLLPTKDMRAFVWHYGYVGEELSTEKANRNLRQLLKDYEMDSEDPRTLMYLHNGCKDRQRKTRYLNEWIAVTEKSEYNQFGELCYIAAIQFYWILNDYKNVIKYSEKLLSQESTSGKIASLEAYFRLGDAYFTLKDFEKAEKTYLKYFENYEKYISGQLNVQGVGVIEGIKESEYERRKFAFVNCLLNLEKYNEAVYKLGETDFSELEEKYLKDVSVCLAELCAATANDKVEISLVSEILATYVRTLKEKYSEKLSAFISDVYWYTKGDSAVTGLFAENLSDTYFGIMFDIMKMLGELKDENDSRMAIQTFLDTLPKCEIGYSPIIWEAVKNVCDLSSVLEKSDRKTMNTFAAAFSKYAEDYADVIKGFVAEYQPETIKELYFEIALLRGLYEDDKDACLIYAMLSANYVSNVYNEEMLNDDDVKVLSDEEQLGYYMFKADSLKQSGDLTGYVHYLREALAVCPAMKETVKELTKEIEQEING